MQLLKRILLRIIIPQITALALCICIIYAFPNLSEEMYLVILLSIFTIAQAPMLKD